MSLKIKQLKYLSPASVNLVLILSLQVSILFLGWYNEWWVLKQNSNQSQLSTAFAEINQEFKTIDSLPGGGDKNTKIQKFSYQLIVGPFSEVTEVNSSSEWKSFVSFWEQNNLSEIAENNQDQQFVRLTQLIEAFTIFATEKNYPTLIRVSNRMKIRDINIADVKSQETALFAFAKDIEFMQATIRNANIDEAKKLEINNLLNEMQVLIVDLQKDTTKRVQGQAIVKNLWTKTKDVLTLVRPLIVQSGIHNSANFNGIFYAFIVIFVFSIALSLWMLISEKNAKSKNKNKLENNFLILLNDAFVKGSHVSSHAFSANFNSTFSQIYNFVLKKMQYGQMFQDTIPFPTILIDSNLQVRWFNQSLIAEWHLEDFIRDRESLSWEHFSQLTNMSANDPVMDVIKNQHAGIFKLQVKPVESEKAVPYQMYVTPYQIGEEKLCLLFFYPLLSLEETIEMQTQSVVGPVRNTLMAMIDNTYNDDFFLQSKSDYEIGTIDELHQLFDDLYVKNTNASDELLNQLTEKDIKLQDQHQLAQSLDNDIEQLKRLQVEMKQSIQDLKQHIIFAFENIDSVKECSTDLFQNLKVHWDKFLALQTNSEKLFAVYQCAKDQVQEMTQIRTTTKEVRDAIQGHRSNAQRVIKAMAVFVDKQSQNRNPIYNTWNSTVNELGKLPDFLTSLDRYIQHNEMMLGKVIMRLEDAYKVVNESHVQHSGPNVTANIASFSSKFEEIEVTKDNLIETLKDVYGLMQQQIKVTSQSQEHLYYSNPATDLDIDKTSAH